MKKLYLIILVFSIYNTGYTQDITNVQLGTKIKIKLKKNYNNVKIKYEFREILKKNGKRNKIIVYFLNYNNNNNNNNNMLSFKFPGINETFSVKKELIETMEIHNGFKRDIISTTLIGFVAGSVLGYILTIPGYAISKLVSVELDPLNGSSTDVSSETNKNRKNMNGHRLALGAIPGAFIGAIVGVFIKSEKWERVSIGNISNNKNRFSHGYTFFDLGFSFK